MQSFYARHLLVGTAFIFSNNAYAQTVDTVAQPAAETAAPQADDGGQLGEIIVTAQRRAENSQDVPIAITTIGGDQAAVMGIRDASTLATAVPGFQFARTAGTSTPFLRGVGSSGVTVGNEPSVATFVDDVYVPNGYATVFDFNNIESVAILKGPQGTLFGRNATGGVIQVRTRDPEFTTTGDFDIGYANYDTISGHAYFSTGLTDKIAFNIAAFGSKQNDGWGTNIPTGGEIFKQKSWGVRGKLLFEVTDDTSILLTGAYNYTRGDQGIAMRIAPGLTGSGGYTPEGLGAGFYDGTSSHESYYETRYRTGSLRVTHEFENATLTSITAYGSLKSPSVFDVDVGPAVFFENRLNVDREKTFTQELQLASADNAPVTWMLGAFYLWDKANSSGNYEVAGTGVNFDAQQKTRSISGFAQASTEILPRLNMTIGLRYTSDRRSASATADNGLPFANPPVAPTLATGRLSDATTFSDITGRFALNYELTPDINIYGAYNRGFKSGVYNYTAVSGTSTAIQNPVLPEELNAYTLGFKSELFDRRVRFNVEAYYYDYKNIQVITLQPTGNVVTNGGAATIKGFDADLTVMPVRGLTITASIAHADGKYDVFDAGPQFFPQAPNAPVVVPSGCPFTAYPVGAGPTIQRPCSLAGNRTLNTIPWSSNLSVQYAQPTDIGEFIFAASWARTGGQYFAADNNPTTRQPIVNPINASLSWKSDGDRFGIRLWAQNINKQKYYAYVAQGTAYGVKYAPASPRTYGVTLSTSF